MPVATECNPRLVAKSAEVQLAQAEDLIRRAIKDLKTLQHGVKPALDAAEEALKQCSKAAVRAELLLERIPV
jgi:hypothetical protein